jgi:Uma2 family endonuclease
MTYAIAHTATFDEFIDFADGNELNEYELVAGRFTLISEPSDWHEEILEFLSFMFELQYRRQKAKLFSPQAQRPNAERQTGKTARYSRN